MLMAGDRNDERKGFSGLADLASEISDIDTPMNLERSFSELNRPARPTQETISALRKEKVEDGRKSADVFLVFSIFFVGAIICWGFISAYLGAPQDNSQGTTPVTTPGSVVASPTVPDLEPVATATSSAGAIPTIEDEETARSAWLRSLRERLEAASVQATPTSAQDNSVTTIGGESLPPTVATPTATLQIEPLPPAGQVLTWTNSKRIAPLKIDTTPGKFYYVKLVDYYLKETALSVFVHGGTSVNIDVPLGTYEIRYASGNDWYGYQHLFGPDTIYSKADELFTFAIQGNQITGYTLTLYQVQDGNLRTSQINPAEF